MIGKDLQHWAQVKLRHTKAKKSIQNSMMSVIKWLAKIYNAGLWSKIEAQKQNRGFKTEWGAKITSAWLAIVGIDYNGNMTTDKSKIYSLVQDEDNDIRQKCDAESSRTCTLCQNWEWTFHFNSQ